MKAACVIVAAGRGARVGATENKLLLPLAGKTPLFYTLQNCAKAGCFSQYVIVCRTEEREAIIEIATDAGMEEPIFAAGGETRQASAYNGVKAVAPDIEIVAVQDGARPFTTPTLLQECVRSCEAHGSGVAGKYAVDTIKEINEAGFFTKTLDRSKLILIETPQVFFREALLQAYEKAKQEQYTATDDAALMEYAGHAVCFVESQEENFKLTKQEDFRRAEAKLSEKKMPKIKIGQGYDIHILKEGRRFVLAGVEIPYEKGLDGHSDADVVAHALTDALLGAAGKGDIGMHFPDTDAIYKDADSMELLKQIWQTLQADYEIGNIDITIFLEQPKLSTFHDVMKASLARTLEISEATINIKAKTAERLGEVGAGNAAAASATCLLYQRI
ncbi:MAG: 2-C-methyl-D-erythritol 4-phosphate cytidylyltransferase [Christensenellaceae bacterium]|jgi:2-C-methyl-D-erythritol 4-phosphate cytidylyltransferase/2-C-methyl-D-erythritol 2,4-cyclodiphosphate synthase